MDDDIKDPRLTTAINEGKEIFRVKSYKNLLKSRRWVNKNLFGKIKKAESNGYKTIIISSWFVDTEALIVAINEIKGVSAKFYASGYAEVKW